MTHSRSENTIERLFELQIGIEYKAADIYKRFSQLFSHTPGLSAFWDGLYGDEIQHAVMLQDVRKSLPPEQLLSYTSKEMWGSVMTIQQMLSKDLLGSVNTLNDAYELAHELEFSEVNAIFKFLTSNLVPSDKQEDVIDLVIKQHQQKLIDFSRNFGDREWRKAIKVQNA
jgi:rubrerythrin